MKVIVVLVLISCLEIVKQKKQVKYAYDLKLPIYEVRSKTYGTINQDPKILAAIYSQGITPLYKQMLHNPKNYFISQGIKKNNIDLEKEIQLDRFVSQKDKQEDINYGELDLKAEEEARKIHYTSNYDQMLVDPNLSYLTLGVHPELNTDETRVIQSDYEDPYIQMSDEEIQELQKQQQKKVQEYRNKIELFLDKISNKTDANVTQHEKQVINQVKSFVDRNVELKDLRDRIGSTIQRITKKPSEVNIDPKQKEVKQKTNDLDIKFKKQQVRYDTSYQTEMSKIFSGLPQDDHKQQQQQLQQQQQQQKTVLSKEQVTKNEILDKVKKDVKNDNNGVVQSRLDKSLKELEDKKGEQMKLDQIKVEQDLGDDKLFNDLEQQIQKRLNNQKKSQLDSQQMVETKLNKQISDNRQYKIMKLKQIDEQGDRLISMIDELELDQKTAKKKKKNKTKSKKEKN